LIIFEELGYLEGLVKQPINVRKRKHNIAVK
jgi:hypothetical protein